MAAYKDLIGQKITKVTSNPGEPKTGQMWYNSTDGKLRGLGIIEAFSSTSPLATTREGAGAFGTQTTAVICGGETPSVSGATEEYDGTGFSAGGTMNTARYRLQGTAGTATAGIVFGGVEPATSNKTETYNGTAWTSSPYTLNTARWCAGAGIQTSALAFGGGPGHKNNTEEFDGEGWTSVNNLNTSRNSLSGAGANAEECLAFGGETSTPPAVATNATESWDGTSWTEVNNLNTARYGGFGAGTQTAALLAGGIVGPGTMQSATETWDGTNWTTSPASLATARGRLSVAGSSTAAIAMAGQTPSITTATEEFNKSTNTITAAAWSAGGNMGTGKYGPAGFGVSQTSQVAAGGLTGSPTATANSESYNGTSWSEGNNLNTARGNAAGGGTETAGIVALGRENPARYGLTEEYDGTSYSEVNDCPETAYRKVGAGTQTALMVCGGLPASFPPYSSTSFEYDGTNWTAGGAMPQQGNYMDGVGVTTAAVIFGATNSPSSDFQFSSLDYDGSSFSANNNMNIPHGGQHTVAGTVTAALVAGGGAPYAVAATAETYDGTSFTTNAVLGQSGQRGGKSGTSTAAIAVGGNSGGPPYALVDTEEYSVETIAANITDFTTS